MNECMNVCSIYVCTYVCITNAMHVCTYAVCMVEEKELLCQLRDCAVPRPSLDSVEKKNQPLLGIESRFRVHRTRRLATTDSALSSSYTVFHIHVAVGWAEALCRPGTSV
jgi:hypothetical protein